MRMNDERERTARRELEQDRIRRIAGQVVDDMLTDLIDDLNLSGSETDGRAADRLERVRTLHRARITRTEDSRG